MTMEFDVIKDARALLADLKTPRALLADWKTPSEKTIRGYLVECERLNKKAANKGLNSVIEIARDTKSAATWYRRRAALLFKYSEMTVNQLKKQDQLQRKMQQEPGNLALKNEWQNTVQNVRQCAKVITKIKEVPPIPQDERKKRASKKRSLNGLPDDWRLILAKRFSPKYALPFLVAAATGCRPAELANGVELAIDRDEKTDVMSIRATIQGVKVRETTGQPERHIFITVDNIEGSIASQLACAIRAGHAQVKIENPSLFSCAIRDAGRRAWKSRRLELSAYSLRHQFAADMKGANFSLQDIATAMGHVTDKTASYYGNRHQSRSGGVGLDQVSATRKIRKKASKGLKPT